MWSLFGRIMILKDERSVWIRKLSLDENVDELTNREDGCQCVIRFLLLLKKTNPRN